jgi:uncharacterized C2H2 Zn-finger protein
MHLIYFRIQNEATVMDSCDEHIKELVQCSQKFSEGTTSLAINSQLGGTKSYKCQLCNEIFFSAHKLFSHELKKHEHVVTSQTDQNKKPSLQMYGQYEEVLSSKNDAHQTKILHGNPWTEALNTINSQKQEWDLQTEACNMKGKPHKHNGSLQTGILNMGQKPDRDQEMGISNKGRKQDGNQQTDISNMRQKQDGNPQTEVFNTGENHKEQYRCRLRTKIFSSLNDSLQHENKTHDWGVEANTEDDNSEKKDTVEEHSSVYLCHLCKNIFNSETDVLIHEIRKHDNVTSDQNAYPVSEESCTSESELQHHNREPELLQQDDGHFESNVSGKGEETASERMKLPELVTTSESEGIPLPYKCPTCDKSFETKCHLFYHDLEVHVGITKPGTAQSIKGIQKNEKKKATSSEGGMKRTAKHTSNEQQPMKVIITEKQSNGEKVKENQKIDKSIAKQTTIKIWKVVAGDRVTKKLIMKERILHGKGMNMKEESEKLHKHIQKTIEGLTGKIPWKETSDEIGGENKVDEQGGQTQPKTFVIVKNGPQTGEGNQKVSRGCRIDVITNYVLSQSQVKQFLMNDGDWDIE